MCFISSQLIFCSLLTEIKSTPKKTLFTPLMERIFLIKLLFVLSFFFISYEPLFDTTFPGRNLREFGFGVV